MNYLQEAAGQNATAIGFGYRRMWQENLAWVLIRLMIQVRRYPVMGEDLTVTTWPSGVDSRSAHRDYLITDQAGNKIAAATSSWVTFDMEERAMAPIPAFVEEAFNTFPDRALNFTTRTIPRLKEAVHEKVFHVRESDLDANGHVNNVHFIDWAVESIPRPERDNLRLAEVDVVFRQECKYGDIVFTRSSAGMEENPARFDHSIVRHPDGAELARLRTYWV
ncbi:hypothetical protein GF324_09815 [bacterium]|nr:hypothetical protein [bacterium]